MQPQELLISIVEVVVSYLIYIYRIAALSSLPPCKKMSSVGPPSTMRVLFCLLPLASALQLPTEAPQTQSRRSVLSLVVASFAAPLAAHADSGVLPREGGALAATCMGFGCNSYSNTDFNGLPKEDAPVGSLPYPDFLKALKEKKVEGVVFQPPSGDVAFALIDGKSVRIHI